MYTVQSFKIQIKSKLEIYFTSFIFPGLLNLRGSDIPYNPVFYAYVVVTMQDVLVFIDDQKITPAVQTHFSTESLNVTLHPYEKVFSYLEDLVSTVTIHTGGLQGQINK